MQRPFAIAGASHFVLFGALLLRRFVHDLIDRAWNIQSTADGGPLPLAGGDPRRLGTASKG